MKPIFVITFPEPISESLVEHLKVFKTKMEQDYHVLFMMGEETKCELFSIENTEPTTIEEIKQLLKL